MPGSLGLRDTRAIFLGGTGAKKWHMGPTYGGIDAELVPLPGRGLGEIKETYAEVREIVLPMLDDVDGPVVLGGHSQGGVLALMLALDSELKERVVNTIPVATPSRGFSEDMSELPLGARALMWLYRNPVAGKGMLETSDFMMELSEGMSTEWSRANRLTAFVPAGDRVVPVTRQLGLSLPWGQEVHEILHGTPRQVSRALGRAAMAGIVTDKVEIEYSRLWSGHVLAGKGMRSIINKVIREEHPEYVRAA